VLREFLVDWRHRILSLVRQYFLLAITSFSYHYSLPTSRCAKIPGASHPVD
jgi:hypothetical protein